jgi:curved DNA-binding protein CbpA
MGTSATPQSQGIEPACYPEDLYGVLGLQKTCSKKEIQKAYWGIAAKYHPDKDDSPEALEIYRNASYAYQILGKDERTRAKYDRDGSAMLMVEGLVDLSSIFMPLATEVAVPLVKAGVAGVSKVALPFLSDMIEQTSVAVSTLLEDEQSDTKERRNELSAGSSQRPGAVRTEKEGRAAAGSRAQRVQAAVRATADKQSIKVSLSVSHLTYSLLYSEYLYLSLFLLSFLPSFLPSFLASFLPFFLSIFPCTYSFSLGNRTLNFYTSGTFAN